MTRRKHELREGSRMDRAIGVLAKLGPMSAKDFTATLISLSDSKQQATNLRCEMQRMGYINQTIELSPLAEKIVKGEI